MANLQANLRGQLSTSFDQSQRLLQSVNQLFYENTSDNAYATLFFAEYDDKLQSLRYANCGHLPALLLRSHDATHHTATHHTLERLDSTCTVLGLFKDWECHAQEVRMLPGDIFALYTDGVTEACNEQGEEFGEERLAEALRKGRDLSASELLAVLVDEVQRFSPKEQFDDITLIIARCRDSAQQSLFTPSA
jgi:serine phosphatase RsbU (regulator of sigma subunit)